MELSQRTSRDLQRISDYFTEVRLGLRKITNGQVKLLAGIIRAHIKTRYGEVANTARSPINRLALTRGKEFGPISMRPARIGLPGTSVMHVLGRSTIVTMMGSGHYRIQIDPSAVHTHGNLRYPGGVPLGLLAWFHENPVPVAMPVTTRMTVYLRLLREGRGGFGTRKGTGHPVANRVTARGHIIIRPPTRPVWRRVIERLVQLGAFSTQAIAIELAQTAQRHGAKVHYVPLPRY